MLSFPLGALSAIFSLLAGGFWMSAAYGKSVEFPWQQPRRIPLAGMPAHQAKWNARAALCASVVSILQAVLFLYDKWPLTFSQNGSKISRCSIHGA
jgi:hypothetical protein